MLCEIRVNDVDTTQNTIFVALTGLNNPFGLTRSFGVGGAGTVNLSLWCETDHPTVAANAPIPALTAVFVPTQY